MGRVMVPKRKTPKQIAASRRNIAKARAAKKRGIVKDVPFTEAVKSMSDAELLSWRKRYRGKSDSISMIHANAVKFEMGLRKDRSGKRIRK